MNRFKGELVRLNTKTGKVEVFKIDMREPEGSPKRKEMNMQEGLNLTLHCTRVLEGNKKRLAIKQP